MHVRRLIIYNYSFRKKLGKLVPCAISASHDSLQLRQAWTTALGDRNLTEDLLFPIHNAHFNSKGNRVRKKYLSKMSF